MKIKSLVLASLLVGSSVFGSEHEMVTEHEELENYIAVKGMYTFGDDYEHESGEDGFGIGIDLGHRLGHGFAIEVDLSYESADVTAKEEEAGEIVSITETAKYYTTSLDLVYVYELPYEVGIFGKVGYEYEYEEIGEASGDDTGFIFAVGAEYALNHTYKLLMEYETSTIDGPKGDMVYAGIMYNF